MRPLFSDAPMEQRAQTMPAPSGVSQLAAALSRPLPPMQLPPASVGAMPLKSLTDAIKANQAIPTDAQLNSAPAGQGGMIQQQAPQWTASESPPQQPSWLQQLAPQMPGQIDPTVNAPLPSMGAGQTPGALPGQGGILQSLQSLFGSSGSPAQ